MHALRGRVLADLLRHQVWHVIASASFTRARDDVDSLDSKTSWHILAARLGHSVERALVLRKRGLHVHRDAIDPAKEERFDVFEYEVLVAHAEQCYDRSANTLVVQERIGDGVKLRVVNAALPLLSLQAVLYELLPKLEAGDCVPVHSSDT
jgi:hypothetical protein